MLAINDLLAIRGPCTGAELLGLTGTKVFPLWQACCTPDIVMRRVGRRYLRLDRAVEGYARLSPSIRREFLNYTVVGLIEQIDEVATRCLELQQEFVRASQHKRQLAQDFVRRVIESSPNRERLRTHVCYMIGGAVIYDMAHTFERLESSTGRLVRGSDLDLVIVSDEEFTVEEQEELDGLVYREKWHMMVLPQFREEIDYVVKDMGKVLIQLQFNNLQHMIACKILRESEFLYGSVDLFSRIKRLVGEFGIPDKLKRMEDRAIQERETAEMQLVRDPETKHAQAWLRLFFTDAAWEDIC
jgi:predicted nucleotidyltransferase